MVRRKRVYQPLYMARLVAGHAYNNKGKAAREGEMCNEHPLPTSERHASGTADVQHDGLGARKGTRRGNKKDQRHDKLQQPIPPYTQPQNFVPPEQKRTRRANAKNRGPPFYPSWPPLYPLWQSIWVHACTYAWSASSFSEDKPREDDARGATQPVNVLFQPAGATVAVASTSISTVHKGSHCVSTVATVSSTCSEPRSGAGGQHAYPGMCQTNAVVYWSGSPALTGNRYWGNNCSS